MLFCPLLALSLCFMRCMASAMSFQYLPLPNIDVQSLGELAIVGEFDGIDLYNHANQTSTLPPGTSSLLLSYNNSIFNLGSTNFGGTLATVCVLPVSDGHEVYIGGNFSSFVNVSANNIVRYNSASQTFDSLQGGLDGPVHAIACDEARNSVYVGGSFIQPTNISGLSASTAFANAAIWTPQNTTWSPFPFKGFDSSVFTIAQNTNNESVYFGGAFSSTGNASALTATNSQPVNFASAQVTAQNSASTQGFGQPNNSICSNGTDGPQYSWLLQDQSPGSLQAVFPYTIQPSLLRLRNTNYQGRGTKTFRVIAIPQNGIMNLTYVDASSGRAGHCEAFCPLSNESSAIYQDFQFVNVIGMTGFRFEILDWYGNGGGLHDIEVYQAAIYVYANDAYNVAPCGNSTQKSSAELVGNWNLETSSEISGQYLSTTFSSSQLSSANSSIIYSPYLTQSGVYSILLYTPGCRGPGTCDQRTTVDVVVNYAPGKSLTITVYQTNNDEKYDTIYTGPVQTASSDFQPSVAVRISANPAAVSADTVEFVAQSVQFVLNGHGTGLNGLYEWTITDANQNLTKFDMAGATLPIGTTVNAISPTKNGVFIGGNFGLVNGTSANAFEFANNVTVPLAAEGLNGQVNAIIAIGSDVYFGGEFNTTFSGSVQSLNNIARYSTADGQWHPLASGVNGPVESVSLTNAGDILAISGQFTQLVDSGLNVAGTAFWNASAMQWSTSGPLVAGQEQANCQYVESGQTFAYIAGAITAYSSSSSYGASRFENAGSTSTYGIMDAGADVYSASFYKNQSDTVAVLGGSFQSSDARNVVLASSSGLQAPIGSSVVGEVYASQVINNKLYLGGNFSANNGSILMIYDLTNGRWQMTPALVAATGLPIIYSMVQSPSDDGLIVAGSFDAADSVSCTSICLWNEQGAHWSTYGAGLSGLVTFMEVSQTHLLVGGDLRLNNQSSYLNLLNTDTMAWTGLPKLPGVPSALAINDGNLNDTFVAGSRADGSLYIVKFNGSTYTDIDSGYFTQPSVLDQIQVLPLADYSTDDASIGPNRILLATGNFTTTESAPYSGVVYDGSAWKPYLLTTTLSGVPGRVRGVFHSMPVFIHQFVSHLPVALVILISIAISLGLVFLLVLANLLWTYCRRRKDDEVRPEKLSTGSKSLLAAVGASSVFSSATARHQKEQEKAAQTTENTSTMSTKRTVVNPDFNSDSVKSKSFGLFGAIGLGSRNSTLRRSYRIATPNSPQVYSAKHTFIAKEQGELGFSEGDRITVLDNSDELWWLGKNNSGTEGIFPASYLI